ncbi:hypothetical protein CMEL01_00960 [Colletotrichum melonis]|uniref:Uncharacterized protein n=1 Tax=Colletotrichum melonis TaxID=1209925 RepID=A0AAI9V2A8_9PEZI|nr:hypothetical protein CMEL01_00960 [Colletotrichum melonis]
MVGSGTGICTNTDGGCRRFWVGSSGGRTDGKGLGFGIQYGPENGVGFSGSCFFFFSFLLFCLRRVFLSLRFYPSPALLHFSAIGQFCGTVFPSNFLSFLSPDFFHALDSGSLHLTNRFKSQSNGKLSRGKTTRSEREPEESMEDG